MTSRDFDGLEESFDPAAEWMELPAGELRVGPDALGRMFRLWVAAFPDLRLQYGIVSGTSTVVTAELVLLGTHSGPLQLKGADEELRPTNRDMELPVCLVFEFVGERIVRGRAYYDALGLLEQLGVLDPGRVVAA